MGAFPGFIFRKSDTPASGTHQKPSTHRVAALGVSYPDSDPRNLVVGGDGASNKYPAWNPATTYTMGTTLLADIVEANGQQWALHTTQAPTATFPGTANWFELRPLLWWGTIWGDVRDTSDAAATKSIMNAWVDAGNPLRFFQYIYPWVVLPTGEHYSVPAAAFIDSLNGGFGGWMSTDGAALTNLSKSCTTVSGSNEVGCADTSGITVGMDVRGTGIPSACRVLAILTGPARFTIGDTSTGAVKNATATGSPTLALTNRSSRSDQTTGPVTAMQAAAARVLEYRDTSGDTWPSWYAKQVAGADATYTGFPIYGFATDDVINMTPQRTAQGDYFNSTFSESQNYFGTGHHRAGVREDSTADAAREAIQVGIAAGWRELVRGAPGKRVFSNSGQSKRPPTGAWDKKVDVVLFEGTASFYSDESGNLQNGWKQIYRNVKGMCESVGRSKLAPVAWHWKNYEDDSAVGSAADPITQPFHRDRRFSLCSTLLSDAANLWSYDGSPLGSYDSEVKHRFYIAELDAPIGVPAEAMPDPDGDGSGIWSRQYTNGIVVVRPKPGTGSPRAGWATASAITFILPFDCVELTGTLDPEDQGRTILAGATISLLPRDARILLRA